MWTDYVTTAVEDQQKFVVPLNRDTEKLYYNQRLILDNKVLTEPRTWKVSKVNRIGNNGLVMITTAQDMFDEHKDYIEINNNGDVIGLWADYYASAIPPTEFPIEKTDISISYSGIKPEIKIGGNYKKFTVNTNNDGTWTFAVDGQDASDILSIKDEDNVVRVKFLGDNSYIGKILTITFNDGTNQATLDVEITTL